MYISYKLQKMGSGEGIYLNKSYKKILGIKDNKVLISFENNKMIVEAEKEEIKNSNKLICSKCKDDVSDIQKMLVNGLCQVCFQNKHLTKL
jgi:formylmethanofuran dehydrogenase subunit E